MKRRNINPKQIVFTIRNPDWIVPGNKGRLIYQRKFLSKKKNQIRLLRVITKVTIKEFIILTVYETTKIQKYLREKKQ